MSVRLNGTDQYLLGKRLSDLAPGTQAFYLNLWFKRNGTLPSAPSADVAAQYGDTSGERYRVQLQTDLIKGQGFDGTDARSSVVADSRVGTQQTWRMVTLTRASGTSGIRLFVDTHNTTISGTLTSIDDVAGALLTLGAGSLADSPAAIKLAHVAIGIGTQITGSNINEIWNDGTPPVNMNTLATIPPPRFWATLANDGVNSASKIKAQSTSYIRYDGVDENTDLGRLTNLEIGTGPFTLAYTMRSDASISAGQQTFIYGKSNNAFFGVLVTNADGTNPDKLRFRVVGSSDDDQIHSDSAIAGDGVKYRVVMTRRSDGTMELYLNGTKQAETANSTADVQADVANVGHIASGLSGNNMSGYVSEIAFYDVGFDQDDVDEDYNNGLLFDPQTHTKAASLKHYWKNGVGNDTSTSPDTVGGEDGSHNNLEDQDVHDFDLTPQNLVASDISSDEPPTAKSTNTDGVDERIEFGNQPTLINFGTGDFSGACWVKSAAASATAQAIMSYATTDSLNRDFWSLRLSGGGLARLVIQDGVGPASIIDGTSNLENTSIWTHVGFARRSGTVYIYVNGTQEGSGASAEDLADPVNGAFVIGMFPVSGGSLFAKLFLRNAAVWNVGLTTAQVRRAYRCGLSRALESIPGLPDPIFRCNLGDGDDLATNGFIDRIGSVNGSAQNLEPLDIQEDVPSGVEVPQCFPGVYQPTSIFGAFDRIYPRSIKSVGTP